jgi:pimeloyl-ACP methyl ester carboxylesterase
MRSPNVRTTRRSMARGVIGPRAAEQAPDGFFQTVHEGMRQPGFRMAMLSHMWLGLHMGRPRPVLMIHGDEDPYGSPQIGGRAAALMRDARCEVIPGRHAPFLDDAERFAAWIRELLARAPAAIARSPEAGRATRDDR